MLIAGLLAQAAVAVAAPVRQQEGVSSYSPEFFAAQQPGTAIDMLNRLPGFTLDTGASVRGFEGAGDFMNSVAVSPDGGIVVAGGHDGTLRVWNGKNGERLNAFASSPEKPARVPKDSER